jgi:hypothetical protein
VSELTDFVLRMIEEDEAAARVAAYPPDGTYPEVVIRAGGEDVTLGPPITREWFYYGGPGYGSCVIRPGDDGGQDIAEVPLDHREVADFVTRHDPAHVLAQCAAYREIVDRCGPYLDPFSWTADRACTAEHELAEATLRALASVWAGHRGGTGVGAVTTFRYPRLNPIRRRVWRDGETWTASYWRPNGRSTVSGCETRAEALEALRQSVGMKVEEIDGRFVEVQRKPHWWWPR